MGNGINVRGLGIVKARMPHLIREQEILRIAAALTHSDSSAALSATRKEVLNWARKRAGGWLPAAAWNGDSFECLRGGRTILGVRLQADDTDLWALRADDPDKEIAGRNWTTEVTLGRAGAGEPRFSVRLSVSTPEETLEIEPHAPGLVQQLADNFGLEVHGYRATSTPLVIREDSDVESLLTMLEDRGRLLPMFVASGDERDFSNPDQPLIDVQALARATVGMAHVVVVPARHTYALSDAFGQLRSVFHGAVRVYLPGFDASADPFAHKLFLSEGIRAEPQRCTRILRSFAAAESLRRNRIGHDVLPYVSVRSAALRVEQERRSVDGASDDDQLEGARQRIEVLEAEIKEIKAERDQYVEMVDQEEKRAKDAESRERAAIYRVQQLHEALQQRGQTPDADIPIPAVWDGFADWCDRVLAGRVVLAPAARAGIRAPEFTDVAQVARCLLWLAGECRERRMVGGGSLANIQIGGGIQNAPCGTDTFVFDFRGKRLEADWHIKKGGNTRDPSRCLRIYYGWDANSQQIVIADMPAHRRTGAT